MSAVPAVVTVTLNPAIDQTISVEHLCPGTVQRALSVQFNAGGKGVNVASCLADWGVAVTATGILGQDNIAPFSQLFAAKGIADRFIRRPGETRTNIKIVETVGARTTDINLPGLTVDLAALTEVQGVLADTVTAGTLVVLAGSLPASLSVETYVTLVARLTSRGAKVICDASGAALAAVLAAPAGQMPVCVKPNRHELEDWIGRPLPDLAAVGSAGRALQERGIALVVVSLGADGALLLRGGRAVRARLPVLRVLSTVGAGDAMVAGLTSALRDGLDLDATARRAVAFAAAKLAGIGPHLPDPSQVGRLAENVEITEISL